MITGSKNVWKINNWNKAVFSNFRKQVITIYDVFCFTITISKKDYLYGKKSDYHISKYKCQLFPWLYTIALYFLNEYLHFFHVTSFKHPRKTQVWKHLSLALFYRKIHFKVKKEVFWWHLCNKEQGALHTAVLLIHHVLLCVWLLTTWRH